MEKNTYFKTSNWKNFGCTWIFSAVTLMTFRPFSVKSFAFNEPKWTRAPLAFFKQWAAVSTHWFEINDPPHAAFPCGI